MALTSLKREHVEGKALLFAGLAAMILLNLIQFLPLPNNFWGMQLSRSLPRIIYETGGVEIPGSLITISPLPAVDSLLHLALPLAVLLLGVQLNHRDLNRLLPVIIGLGVLSGILGLLQAIGGAEGPFYFYRVTNRGNAVGLFANRNHAALLLACLLPMLAVLAAVPQQNRGIRNNRKILALAIAVLVAPLLLVTGSRSGILIGLLSLAGSAILFRTINSGRFGNGLGKWSVTLGMGAGLCIVFLTILYSRAEALDRLLATAEAEDMRLEYWRATAGFFWQYFPLGAGSASFADIYRIAEPDSVLNYNFVNHAHNDWLETAVSFGLPGIVLILFAMIFFLKRFFIVGFRMQGSRYSVIFARMAGLNLALIGVASLTDYPLRTPLFACLFAVMILWFVGPNPAIGKGSDT